MGAVGDRTTGGGVRGLCQARALVGEGVVGSSGRWAEFGPYGKYQGVEVLRFGDGDRGSCVLDELRVRPGWFRVETVVFKQSPCGAWCGCVGDGEVGYVFAPVGRGAWFVLDREGGCWSP